MRRGDSFYARPHAIHVVLCLEAGVLADVFSQVRKDFLKQGEKVCGTISDVG